VIESYSPTDNRRELAILLNPHSWNPGVAVSFAGISVCRPMLARVWKTAGGGSGRPNNSCPWVAVSSGPCVLGNGGGRGTRLKWPERGGYYAAARQAFNPLHGAPTDRRRAEAPSYFDSGEKSIEAVLRLSA